MAQNIDPATVESFGDEWSRYDQTQLSEAEARSIFDEYFAIFPWERLPADASGFDMGCGSGRWARLMAPRVGHLHCIDPSVALDTARRELAEEVGLAAERWSLLVTQHPSPGFCDELVHLYLAEGLTEVGKPLEFVVEHEEADMTVERIPLADAVQQVFDGTIRNSLAVIGLLAAAQVRANPVRLRPVDAT